MLTVSKKTITNYSYVIHWRVLSTLSLVLLRIADFQQRNSNKII